MANLLEEQRQDLNELLKAYCLGLVKEKNNKDIKFYLKI